MANRSLVEVSEMDALNLQSLGIKSITYNFDGCEYDEVGTRVREAIGREAPPGSEFYYPMSEEAVPNRPIGLALAGQPPSPLPS